MNIIVSLKIGFQAKNKNVFISNEKKQKIKFIIINHNSGSSSWSEKKAY